MGWAARANRVSRVNKPTQPPKPVIERPSFKFPMPLEQSLSMLLSGARRRRRGLVSAIPPVEPPPAEGAHEPESV